MKRTMDHQWMRTFLVFALGLLASFSLLAQTNPTIKVKGVVKDELGPVIGASVLVEGAAGGAGTVTDVDGRFELKAPKNSNLVVSYIGYKPQTVKATEADILVVLKEDSELLDEVVVIGYGSVKKKDATGSVTAIKVEEMNKGLATTPQDLLGGKIAGVSVVSKGGRPGEGSDIRIRGGSSLSAKNDPLIIIDGVMMSNDQAGLSNPLSMLNPADIATFTVLKDASATAIYGSRASNGVVLITTKQGVIGKPQISVNSNFSLNTRRNSVDVMKGDEYREFMEQTFKNDSKYADMKKRIGTANTDWQDEIYQTAFAMDHNVSVYGSVGKAMPYRASVGYTNEEGILKTSKMERVTGNFVLSPSFFDDHLKVTVNGKGMFSKTRFADDGAIGAAVSFDPTQPVYNGSPWGGFTTWTDSNGVPASIAGKNPVAMLKMKNNKAYVHNFLGNVQADYKLHFFPDLRVNVNVGIDVATTDGTDYSSPWSPVSFNENDAKSGSRKRFENFRNNQLFEAYTQYVKDVDAIKSKFDVMAGYSWQRYKRTEDNFTHFVSKIDDSDLDRTDTNNNYQYKENYLISVFGRFNYTYNEKYLLTFTMRNDGSSRFSDGNRWGLFPSVAGAWRLKDEAFMKDFTALSDLKVRVGWGKTGQQDLGDDFQYLYPGTASYLSGKDYGYYPMGVDADGKIIWVKQSRPSAYNTKLKWETTTTWNAGIDFGFLNNRINGAIDVYHRKTTDLLNREAPTIAGISLGEQVPQNIGTMVNKGIEFSVNARPIVTKDLEWELGFNIAYNHSKITQLTVNEDKDFMGQGVNDTKGDGGEKLQRFITGYAPYTFYVYEQVYDASGKPLEGVYVDRNNDGKLDEKDKYLYKKPAADVLMGFSSKVTFRQWDFGFNGRVSLGNYVFNAAAANAADISTPALFPNNLSLSNKPYSALETDFQSKQVLSDHYVQNASFLKIDNITVGYSLKPLFKNKMRARFYATVQNPIVITKYDGLDPEVTDGIDHNFYPRPLRFMLGFNLNF